MCIHSSICKDVLKRLGAIVAPRCPCCGWRRSWRRSFKNSWRNRSVSLRWRQKLGVFGFRGAEGGAPGDGWRCSWLSCRKMKDKKTDSGRKGWDESLCDTAICSQKRSWVVQWSLDDVEKMYRLQLAGNIDLRFYWTSPTMTRGSKQVSTWAMACQVAKSS